jgi:2-amino-4-hydroxy-6-hydroxymethyldihydropteridine diphosphokinase
MDRFESPKLTLPHPRITERAFVLVPLNDIAPDVVVSGKSIAEWAGICDRSGIEKARDDAGWWLAERTV